METKMKPYLLTLLALFTSITVTQQAWGFLDQLSCPFGFGIPGNGFTVKLGSFPSHSDVIGHPYMSPTVEGDCTDNFGAHFAMSGKYGPSGAYEQLFNTHVY